MHLFLTILFAPILSAFEGVWRRWYGGWIEKPWFEAILPSWVYKILINRGVQTITNILVLWFTFYCFGEWASSWLSEWLIETILPKWLLSLILACIFHFQFWSRGHGPAFDYGRGEPDESTIARYQKVWWATVPNHLVPKEHWYGYYYDFLWMLTRYCVGLIALIPFLGSGMIMWYGLITSAIYSYCWSLWEHDEWVKDYFPLKMVNRPTDIAEIFVGLIVGLTLPFWI